MKNDYSIDIVQKLRTLLKGPAQPGKEFIRSGATFSEVYAMAASLREKLAATENNETPVCLATENKAVIAATILASLAGGPPLLLPYAFSLKALNRAAEATKFSTVISDTTRELPRGTNLINPQLDNSAEKSLSITPAPDSVLLKIFTGGSTGTPQCWSKTAANIMSEALFLAKRYKVDEQDRIIATIPPYHIYGLLFSVVLPLVSSATVINESPSFPAEIERVIQEHKATILVSVPAHYRVLREKNLQLRLSFSSAGMLDVEDNKNFCKNNSAGIIEIYGSTETGGIATRNRSKGDEIFFPFPTVNWKTADHCLAVNSPYISPGLPTDNNSFFITNDRVTPQGKRGFILEGRADSIVKVGGKRVDTEELRLHIKQDNQVADCVVTTLPLPGGRGHFIGVLLEGKHIQLDRIKESLEDTFESYSLPRCLKKVSRIPIKENGKYDWKSITELLKNELSSR